MITWRVETAAASDPVSVTELKTHLRIDGSDEDTLLLLYIQAATEAARNITNRVFIHTTFEEWFPCFRNVMELRQSPLVSVSSIRYLDSDGNEQPLDSSVYQVLPNGIVGRIKLAYNQSWPATQANDLAVKVTYVAGYSEDADDVPKSIRNWILAHAGDAYRHRTLNADLVGNYREVTPIPSLAGLLDPYIVPKVA